MDKVRARTIVTDVIENRKRWGQLYTTGAYSQADLGDALVALEGEIVDALSDSKADLTKSNRQLAASKAREAKLKKQLQACRKKFDKLEKRTYIAGLMEGNSYYEDSLDEIDAQMAWEKYSKNNSDKREQE